MKKVIVLTIGISLLILSCKPTKELATVSSVDLNKYIGTWNEIARFDNSFEKNLTCVTATYSIRKDGKIDVLNRGFNSKKNKWQEANGIAKVPNESVPGELKVSFFRPFYGDYFIMKLDSDYQHVLVGSPSRDYLWILSRTKTIDKDKYDAYVSFAKEKGFDTSLLKKISHDCK